MFAAGGKRTPFCPTQGRTLPSGDHAAEGRGGNQFSMCLDGATIGDEGAVGLCVYIMERELGAGLLHQVWRCDRQTE